MTLGQESFWNAAKDEAADCKTNPKFAGNIKNARVPATRLSLLRLLSAE